MSFSSQKFKCKWLQWPKPAGQIEWKEEQFSQGVFRSTSVQFLLCFILYVSCCWFLMEANRSSVLQNSKGNTWFSVDMCDIHAHTHTHTHTSCLTLVCACWGHLIEVFWQDEFLKDRKWKSPQWLRSMTQWGGGLYFYLFWLDNRRNKYLLSLPFVVAFVYF